MSANQYDLKSIIDSNNLSKENDDKPVPNSANQSESDLSDDETIKLIVRKQKIIAMKLDYARLERDALLITKVAEDAKQQAEAYKKANEAQALVCKQQEEQLQVIRSVAEAKVNAERDARIATERLAAQQVLASTHPRPTIIATPKAAQETSNSKKIKIFQIAAKYNL